MANRPLTSLFAAVLSVAGFTAAAAATPPGVTCSKTAQPLPENYTRFFPSRELSSPTPLERPLMRRVPAAFSSSEDLYGFLYYFMGNELQQGFYRLSENNPQADFLWSDRYTDYSMAMTSGWLRNGRLCGVNQMKMMGGLLAYGQLEIDLLSGEILDFHQLTVSDDVTNVYLAMAYRDLDDCVYGYGHIYDGSAYGFKKADAEDVDKSVSICEVNYNEMCVALCYNQRDDMFYGVNTDGFFVAVSPDGEQTEIMPLNIPKLTTVVTGLVYSPAYDGYLYNAYLEDNTSAMYLIKPDTETCEKLYDFAQGEEYIFMVTTAPSVAPEAPESPVISSVDFAGAAQNGTLTVALPTRTLDGKTLSGELEWRLLVDGKERETGKARAGAIISVNTPDLSNNSHVFAVMAGKDGNWSAAATDRRWIGNDYPLPPSDIILTHTKATWTPPTGSEHGGYVDYAALKYNVTLNGEEIAVTSATECSVTLPEGKPYTSYSVEVTAFAGGHSSEAGQSNYITYGEPLRIPDGGSLHYRPEEYEWPLFKAIDIDGKTDQYGNTRNWHFSETMGFPSFASGADGVDLLVFPPIYFDNTAKTYSFEMESGLISDIDDTGTIEVLIGTSPDLESMTRTVIPATQLHYMRGIIMTGFFSVPEAATYYLGVLTHSNEVAFHISDMDIKLTDRDADVPMIVTDLVAKATPGGALSADVSFTLPTQTVNGQTLPADALLTATVCSRDYVLDHPYEGTPIASTTVTGHPGERVSATVETQQNYNTIGVSVSYDNRAGVETTTMLFTGLVRPFTVTNFKAVVTEDNMGVMLSWDPPTEGEEPGEIGTSFYYGIWYYADAWKFYEGVGYDICEALVELDPENPQTILMIGVMAMNDAGQSDHIASASVVVGKPYDLPMHETLDDNGYELYEPIAIQRPDKTYEGSYWMLTDPAEIASLFANDSGWAYVGFIGMPDLKDINSRLSLPKFSTVDCHGLSFTLEYWGGPYEAPFFLLSEVYGSETPRMEGSFPTDKGWMSHTIELPKDLENLKWVELLLDTKLATEQNFAIFSGYSITAQSGMLLTESEGRISATPGMIHVAGHAGESLLISDMEGRIVKHVDKLADMAGYAVAPGLYTVKAGQESLVIRVK